MSLEKYAFIAPICAQMNCKRYLVFLLMFCAGVLKAQDQTNFTQFYLNPYLLNPSYVGIDGQSAVSLVYKRQWMDIEGGPAIANFAFQTPLSARAAFGISVTNDVRGLLNNSSALITFGYNVPLAPRSFIRFGLSGGGAWNMVDTEPLDPNDDALYNIVNNSAAILGNAGISFHFNTFQIGASMPAMFSPSYLSRDAFTVTEMKPFQSLIFNASNRFYFGNDRHIFEPHVLYRMNANLPPQLEAAGILHLNHTVWLGGSYKQDFGISAFGGLKLNHKIALGAAYSLQNTGANELNSPSFEVNVSLLLGKRRDKAPLYSFVNSEKEKEKKPKKTAAQLAAEKRQAEEQRKRAEEERRRQEEEEAKARVEALARQAREAEEAKRTEEAVENIQRDPEEPAINQGQAVEPVTPPAPQRPATPVSEGRHETFARGTHQHELASGHYVIAGVFSSEENAARYARGLAQLGYAGSYGYLSPKELWYVYIYQSHDVDQARTERDEVRQLRMFRDAWLLTVVE